MIHKEHEQRIRNWVRANRECKKVRKGATLAFCESLRYLYGVPEGEIPTGSSKVRAIDLEDATLLDEAFRDERMTDLARKIIRLEYFTHLKPAVIEGRLSLVHMTYSSHKERAVRHFFAIVDLHERKKKGILSGK